MTRHERAVIALALAGRVIGELWFGVERSVTRELNRDRLIPALARIPKWPFEDEAAQHFGRIHHELRRVGRVMSVVDMQLAAIAFGPGQLHRRHQGRRFKRRAGIAARELGDGVSNRDFEASASTAHTCRPLPRDRAACPQRL